MPLQHLYLARHGETEWSITGQHTGRADIALTARGEQDARLLGARLKGTAFARVFTSPLQRARRTAELAGFPAAELEPDLMEWDYGEYEGKRYVEIRAGRPGWNLFRDGCPRGESVADAGARADRLLAKLRPIDGAVLLFAHGHFLRVVAARFLGLDASGARLLHLGTTSVSILGYEHPPDDPVVRLWNDRLHLEDAARVVVG